MSKECRKAKRTVLGTILLLIIIIFLSSCASSNYQACAAYASVEVKNELK